MSRWYRPLFRIPHAATLSLILMMDLPRLNATSAPRSSIIPTDIRLKPIVGTWSTFSNLTLRVLP